MITDAFFVVLQVIVKSIYALLPSSWIPNLIPIDWSFMKYVYLFISPSIFALIANTFILFTALSFGWVIFEWIYKKIPGIN